MDEVSVIKREFILTSLLRRGEGKSEEDPIRCITQLWTTDGKLIGEDDSFRHPRIKWDDELVRSILFMQGKSNG
jgi:hypothetical protein